MDDRERLEEESQTDHLIFVLFYADWSPHYEWLAPAIREYEKQVNALIKINIENDKDLAELYKVEDVPTFILMQKGRLLWRYTGELTPNLFKMILEQYK